MLTVEVVDDGAILKRCWSDAESAPVSGGGLGCSPSAYCGIYYGDEVGTGWQNDPSWLQSCPPVGGGKQDPVLFVCKLKRMIVLRNSARGVLAGCAW